MINPGWVLEYAPKAVDLYSLTLVHKNNEREKTTPVLTVLLYDLPWLVLEYTPKCADWRPAK